MRLIIKILLIYSATFFNAIQSIDRCNYFQKLLAKTESALKNELDTKLTAQPSIDVFLITARNENEKKFYEVILGKQKAQLFRDDVHIAIIADPDDKGGFIGSTGSLFCALSKFRKKYEKKALGNKSFKDLRIAIIKAGGMARRMIAASAYANKCQMPLPVTKDNIQVNTLYYAILNSYFIGKKMQSKKLSGLIVLCADQLFLSDSDIKEGINYFVDPVSTLEAKRSELIIEHSSTREIIDFKRKPSNELRQKILNNEANATNRIWAELTNNYVIAGASHEFYSMYEKYLMGSDKIENLINNNSRGYEIFTSDAILPFFMEQDDYIALRLKEYQTPNAQVADSEAKRTKFYQHLYVITREYLSPTMYLCGNEYDTYCEEIVDMIRFYKNDIVPSSEVAKIYQFQNGSNSTVPLGAKIAEDCLIYRSTVSKTTTISKGAVVLDSKLYHKSTVGNDSIVINVNGQINIGSKKVLAKIPIRFEDKDAYALVYVGINDNPKNEDAAATIFGEPLKAWLTKKNIVLSPNNISLFTIPLFPIVFEDNLDMQYVAWMTQDGLPTAMYKNAKKLSLQNIADLINYDLLTQIQI